MTIHTGDALAVLRTFQSDSFDGCLTDPPYGISFMGAQWDRGVPSSTVWTEVLRVLKPGASLLAFGGTRTWHRLTCAVEDAGFEIRDCLMWLHGQGMPKGQNISKALLKSTEPDAATAKSFSEYATALKPAWEPVILAMKPMPGSFTFNATTYGVAGLNIEASRTDAGRYPANVLLDNESAALLDEQTGEVGGGFGTENRAESKGRYGSFSGSTAGKVVGFGDTGGASRFFYCSKASTSERQAGLATGKTNDHPTLKPIDLNRYLATLILPPTRQNEPRRLLVPFSGSGSEMIGASLAGWDEIVGIEQDSTFNDISAARLQHWTANCSAA